MPDILHDLPIRATANRVFDAFATPEGLEAWWTRVGVRLEQRGEVTWVRFRHTGWPTVNEHFRVPSCCWAMYLRVLRRWIEYGEQVPYEERLEV